MNGRCFRFLGVVCVVTVLVGTWGNALGEAPANDAFYDSWARSDRSVAELRVNRTWMWGPDAFTPGFMEPYADSPGNARLVQYFDKTRKEINDPDGDQSSPWYVTNGLLAMELITGQLQLGDAQFEGHEPANVQVAGDQHPDSPTYAMLQPLLDEDPVPPGTALVQRLHSNGTTSVDNAMAAYGVTAQHYVPETDHTVASVFWAFMNSSGEIYLNGQYQHGLLFPNPFFGVGFPITEAYWVNVPVATVHKDVLVQCFQRRCLTYTPDNPDGWQVEAGNIGRHYHTWRYEQIADQAPEQTIGPEGGTLLSADGRLSIDIPPGALAGSVEFSILPVLPGDGHENLLAAYQVGPSGASFAVPVTVTYAYNPARIPSSGDPGNLMLYRISGNDWHLLDGISVDTDARTVSGTTTGFSYLVAQADTTVQKPDQDADYWADMHLSWSWRDESGPQVPGVHGESVWIDWQFDLVYGDDDDDDVLGLERTVIGSGSGYLTVKDDLICTPPPPDYDVFINYSQVATADFSFIVWGHRLDNPLIDERNLYLWFEIDQWPEASYSQIGGQGCDGEQIQLDTENLIEAVEDFVSYIAGYPNDLLSHPLDSGDVLEASTIIAYASESGAKTSLTPGIHPDWMDNILLGDPDGYVDWEIVVQDAAYMPLHPLVPQP